LEPGVVGLDDVLGGGLPSNSALCCRRRPWQRQDHLGLAALLAATLATLAALQIETAISINVATLLRMLDEGAGLAIIAEEALTPDLIHDLSAWRIA
jgi:hypothetical protein